MRPYKPANDNVFALFLIGALVFFALLCGCGGAAYTQAVPGAGYHDTLHYRFQAVVRGDSAGCTAMTVRVQNQAKLYSRETAPARLRLYDDDLARPIAFERATFLQDGRRVSLGRPGLNRFWSENLRLHSELGSFLFQANLHNVTCS